MAFALELSSLSKKIKNKIKNDLWVKPKKTQYTPKPRTEYIFSVNKKEDAIYLPLGRWNDYLDEFPHDNKQYPKTKLKFTGELYTEKTDPKKRKRDQKTVVTQAIDRLSDNNSVFIACFTGFGKTMIATYLMCHYKLKTALICHLNTVKDQWPDEILKFTGNRSKIQIIKGKTPLDPDADIYIFGVRKLTTMNRLDLVGIGLVIIDEAHICTLTAFTKSLLKFQPMYVIGLSATPDRKDGLNNILKFYFGESENYIYRHEVKNFTVVKYKTDYKPEISYTVVYGRTTVNWTKLITSIEENSARHKEIVNIVLKHPKDKILVLCARKIQSQGIFDILNDLNEDVGLCINNTKYDKSKRIMIAGVKKGGAGMNDPDLNVLIIASDMSDVRQLEGRCRTVNNTVYHIVDDYNTFEKHWNICEKWYLKRGATINSNINTEKNEKKDCEYKRMLPPNK